MTTVAIGLFVFLIVLVLFQLIIMLKFCSLFWGSFEPNIEREQLPKAAVLLPLRGADPELLNTLHGLMGQDYPDYQIQIILDSENDPSRKYVEQALSESNFEHAYVHAIENRRQTCSPQCSAFYEAANRLDDSVDVVCTIDGDVIAHDTWLQELVAPMLNDSNVAITHGNRWFMPPNSGVGSMVRYLWNAAAIVPMYFLGIPWAGSFAIRHQVLKDSGLLEKWPIAVVPDAPSKKMVDDLGLKVKFVPSLIMVNRESCSLWFAHDFLKRQMMWTRTYHPNWWAVMLYAVGSTLGVVAGFALTISSAILNYWLAFGWFLGGIGIYMLALMMFLMIEELSIRRPIRRRNESTQWLSPVKFFLIPLMIPFTQAVYMSATLLAHFKKTVTWRAVTYHIKSPWDVTIIGDSPFQQDEKIQTNTSL